MPIISCDSFTINSADVVSISPRMTDDYFVLMLTCRSSSPIKAVFDSKDECYKFQKELIDAMGKQ